MATSTACASGVHWIQLGVEAIRRGEAEAALVVGTDASINPESLIRFSLLSALSDPQRSAAGRRAAVQQGPRRVRDGRRRRRAGAREPRHARARGAKVIGVLEGCGEMADGFHRTRSSPDGKPIIACMQQALHDAGLPRMRLATSMRTAPARRERQDGMGRRRRRVRRACIRNSDLVQQFDDRPHADRGRHCGGDLHLARAAARRLPPTINYEIRIPRYRWIACPMSPATSRWRMRSRTRSVSVDRTSAWSSAFREAVVTARAR